MKSKLKIVKIGGNLIDDPISLDKALNDFSSISGNKILIHGGGKLASEMSRKLGLEPKMSGGRRITTAQDLEIVTMVYAGLINKQIVANLQSLDCNALGLTGADANCIASEKRPVCEIDFGFAGDIKKVNSLIIDGFLKQGLVPVFCAITHDQTGQLLNTNADTIASMLAAAMSQYYETELDFCFEKKGVLQDVEDSDSVISVIDSKLYNQLVEEERVHSGMLPKLQMGFDALKNDVSSVIIGDAGIINGTCELCTKLIL
ncbi:MAG: acetylglutamate kinase [Bacteroidales bacterium]|nr:acetylglutamate kinase [Bacteroidales bacterium]